MHARPIPDDGAPLLRYELYVRVPSGGQSWRATLVCSGGQRIEFDRPSALARHLEREARVDSPRGLR